MKKKIIIIISVLLIFGINNFYWFGNYISMSLEIDSISSEIYIVQTAFDDLKKISLYINSNTSKENLIKVLKANVENPEIFEKIGNIYYSRLGFIFEGNKLIKVTQDVEFNENSKG